MLQHRLSKSGQQMLLRNRALFEELFHQGIVSLGNHFHQFFVTSLRRGFQVHWNRNLFPLAVAAHIVGVGLHADEIHHTLQILFRADRQLHGNHRPTECFRHRVDHALVVRAIAVHASADDHPWHLVLFGVSPNFFRRQLPHRHAIDQRDHGLHRRQRHLGFVHEHVEAGRVEEIDLHPFPFGKRNRVADGKTASDFFFVVIGGAEPFST